MVTEHKILQLPDTHINRLEAQLDELAADGYAVQHFATHGDRLAVLLARQSDQVAADTAGEST